MFYNILVKADSDLEICGVKPVDNVFNKTETLLTELQSFLDNTAYLYKSVSKEYSNARDEYYRNYDNRDSYEKLYRATYARKSAIMIMLYWIM